jgi:hypothetical protein
MLIKQFILFSLVIGFIKDSMRNKLQFCCTVKNTVALQPQKDAWYNYEDIVNIPTNKFIIYVPKFFIRGY